MGAILLLKQASDEDCKTSILNLLEQSMVVSSHQSELKELREINKKLTDEYETVVKKKIAEEDELYTKFRILLNKSRT